MKEDLIPPFDFHTVFIAPWQQDPSGFFWIIAMGFFVTMACGLVGNFIIARRMALVGDAISHSLLPGIAVAFIITSSRAPWAIVTGAIIAGILTTVLIEFIHRQSRVKTDAALGIVFSTFFAIGVVLITIFADKVDIDADCVLYGEIGFVPFEPPVTIGGLTLGPVSVVQMGLVACGIAALIFLFYKELLVTSFDAALAKSLGMNPNFYHYGLMVLLSIAIVSAFESVGAILVIAMLIFPGVTAAMLSDRLPIILRLSVLFAALYAFGGLHLAIWLDCSIAGAMVVVGALLWAAAWFFSPRRGLIARWMRLCRPTSPAPEPGSEEQAGSVTP